MDTGPHGVEMDALGAEVKLEVTDAISEVPNMATDAHLEKKSVVADIYPEACKLGTDAQPEEKPAVKHLHIRSSSMGWR